MTLDFLEEFEFFAGVPDSQLKALCSWLYDRYGISDRHVIAANEGNAAALAAAKAANQLTLIEVKCALGARDDLGRPTTTPQENKAAFMAALEGGA